ncbi:hypothetical protein L1987_51714 [Smallanthus sonchifolius]|uniref:Uncharacterized protein n=1 Tax=Smallanthus sonchifolius TaxID=185202 RepID=A0ACB9ER08_9ASTR|nr:hypothetical protein L1987_51714 [Smallanthus sonchifolius]
MGGEPNLPTTSLTLVFIIIFSLISTNARFTPPDNYLIDCGSSQTTILDDGRTFKSDPQSVSFLSTDQNIFATSNSVPENVPIPLYKTARIFNTESVYKFLVFHPGRHFLRLYFHPLHHPEYNLTTAVFTVKTDAGLVLLHDFSASQNSDCLFKEYLINVTSDDFSLIFSPLKKSPAFVNAIEFVSAPNELVPDSATTISPPGVFTGVSAYDLQVVHRVNVGGPMVNPKNDTLSRTWMSDSHGYMVFPKGEKVVSVDPGVINYPVGGATALIAPDQVYSSAASMADSGVSVPNFNLTWEMNVDPGFSYLIRLHFCDIVSTSLNSLYFNVYVNGLTGVNGLDLSALASDLAMAYYKDFVINASTVVKGVIRVQVGPSDLESTTPNAILNGLEVMKMSSSAGSLDGLFSSGSNSSGGSKRLPMTIAETIGVAIGVIMLLVLIFSLVRKKNKTKGWDEGGNSFTSWFLPINASYCSSLLSSKSKSKNGSVMFSKVGIGRSFGFNELRDATKNFDESAVIGVNLAEWAMHKQRKGVIDTIVDPIIAKTISSESLIKYVEAAEKCLAEYGVDRPSMGDVLWNLEFALQLQDASLQLDPPEEDDTCKAKTKVVASSEDVKKDEKKRKNNESDVSILINDDSGVVMGSPLFSKMEDIEGR